MKALYTFLLAAFSAVLLLPAAAKAQGGFGHFSFGPAIGNYQKPQRDLQQHHMLGQDFSLGTTGIMVGGKGMAYFPGGLLVGGSGFGSFYGSGVGTRGEAELSSGGGFFNLGYALHQQEGWLLYPYVGVGGLVTTLEIQNKGNNPLPLSTNHSLQPGERGKYSTGGLALEGGFGITKLLAKGDNRSGLLIGVELGTCGLPVLQAWEYDGDNAKVTGITSSRSQSYYLRITFGGGRY